MKQGVLGGVGFGVVVLGSSLTVSLTGKKDKMKEIQEFGPAVFYTVWPVLVLLLSIVFGMLLEILKSKVSEQEKVSASKRARVIATLTLVCLMGALIIIYPSVSLGLNKREQALASVSISMLMLLFSVTAAFLLGSVKKGAGALLAPQVAWLVVANNLALHQWRKELSSNEK